MKALLLGSIVAALVVHGARAQEQGDPNAGLAYAEDVCARCHAIAAGDRHSPKIDAPSFEAIANSPGMSPMALAVALQTPHETMPNLVIAPEDLHDVIAYIVTLKD